MSDVLATIQQIEERVEDALWKLEVQGAWEEALAVYEAARAALESLGFLPEAPAFRAQQRVLAYCLMRLSNILRQLNRHAEASALAEEELSAARACGDTVTLGRSLMSHSVAAIMNGRVEEGLQQLDEARRLFEEGDSADHKQGLGWHWILRADLSNGGVVPEEPRRAIEAAGRALAVLLPIENWTGVARAYAARARAHETIGNTEAAAEDRAQQEHYGHLAVEGGSSARKEQCDG